MKATIRNKTALTLAAGLAALVVTSSPAAAAALTWDGSASMNWNTTDANWGGAWTNGSDAVFGATGVGTVTLGSAVTANSVAFNATGYTIAGSGGNALTINSGGITANAAATISAPVTLGAEQSWIVPGASGTTELTVSGNISGTYGLTIGSLVQTLSSSTFLTTTAQNIFPGVQLSSITAVAGKMGGGWVNGGTPLAATGYFWNLSGTTATYQLQTVDVGYAKAVLVTLTQNGADVYASETAAKYVAPPNGVSSLGTNASNSPWLAAGLAQSQGAGGYGVFSTTITTGQIANGTVVLSGTNSYNGPTKVLSGTARFAQQVSLYNGSNGSWTAANIDVKPGATLALNVGGAGEFTAADIAILAGLGGGTNGFESGASLGLDTTNAGGTFTCGSALANPNGGANALGLNKLGGGNLVLTGSNSYTGPTVISAGTLTFNSASAQTIGGAISGAGTLTQAGPGTLTLNGGNSYTGGTIISGGVLKAGTNTALGTQTGGNVGDVTIQSGATLDINGRNLGYGITLAGSGADGQGALVNTGAAPSGSVTQTPNISLSADAAIGGSGNFEMIQVNNAANSLALNNHTLTKFGTNTFYLSNTTVGAGTIHIAQGVFSQDIGYGVSSAAGVAFVLDNTAGVTLAVNGADLTIGSITGGGTTGGNVTLGNRMLTVGGDNSSPAPYAGTISGTGGSLTKVGSGTLTLSGANTYTGATTVNEGTLALGANDVLPDGSAVAIGAGTLDAATFTDTAGTLDVTAAATINLGSGGSLAFADSSAIDWTGGTLDITGTLGATSLRFGTSSSGLTEPQLALVSVNGGGAGTYTLNADGYLVAAGPRPEIAVEQPAGTNIPSGSGSRDFGTVTLGSDTSLEFTIRNPGTADLNLTGTPPDYVVITGADASDFTATAQPSTPVTAGGGTTTFTVRFAPGGAGARNAALSIANDDPTGGEDPFVINLSGTGQSLQTPYEAWSGGNGFNTLNGEGIAYGMAWMLGAGTSTSPSVQLLPAALPGSGLTMHFKRVHDQGAAKLYFQYSSDLVTWPDPGLLIPDNQYGTGIELATGITAAITEGDPDDVTVTVVPAGHEAEGKLFGRLKATEN
jgi:autotransporter-associated beta strand protein